MALIISIGLGMKISRYFIAKQVNNINFDSYQCKIDGFNLTATGKKRENFIVADAQDFHNYENLKEKTMKMRDDFDEDDIDRPDRHNTVKYDDDIATLQYVTKDEPCKNLKIKEQLKKEINKSDFGANYPTEFLACHNASVSQKFRSHGKNLLPNQISCQSPNKIQADEYYKINSDKMSVPLEDRYVRGYNYGDYSSAVEPTKIDIRILSKTTQGLATNGNNEDAPIKNASEETIRKPSNKLNDGAGGFSDKHTKSGKSSDKSGGAGGKSKNSAETTIEPQLTKPVTTNLVESSNFAFHNTPAMRMDANTRI